jgi:molybdenum cofactor guanylyltransferase
MGQDKALMLLDGQPMARRVADAALAAGAVSVVALGGDPEALASIGLTCRPDDHPGDGPLPAVVAALRECSTEVLLVVPCDLVAPSSAAMAATARALVEEPSADLAVPVDGAGRRQWAHAAWRRRAAARLAASVAAGSRSLAEAAASLTVVDVAGLDPAALRDADRPEELPGAG